MDQLMLKLLCHIKTNMQKKKYIEIIYIHNKVKGYLINIYLIYVKNDLEPLKQ